jgi:hypothetical protein
LSCILGSRPRAFCDVHCTTSAIRTHLPHPLPK